jgi:hypothetical protein
MSENTLQGLLGTDPVAMEGGWTVLGMGFRAEGSWHSALGLSVGGVGSSWLSALKIRLRFLGHVEEQGRASTWMYSAR